MKASRRASIVLWTAAGLLGPLHAQEADISVDLEAGLQYSDNIGRYSAANAENADEETVYVAGLDFVFDKDINALAVDFRGSAKRHAYDSNSFDDETLATVAGNLNYAIVPGRLAWTLDVNHGQQVVDPFRAVLP